MTPALLAKVEKALERGPKADGYPTELWALTRVAEVIEATTGVRYHPGHVWRVLRQMGWSRQRPARWAIESGLSVIPSVKATWAPRGRTQGTAPPLQPLEAPLDVCCGVPAPRRLRWRAGLRHAPGRRD